jgi:succinate-semialdehyde dehydrogenase/glutarate-semialdehyde dehydrogenase
MAMPISSQAPDAKEAGFYPKIELLIGGEWRSRQGSPIINPADAAVIGHVPHATREDLADAVIAAERGFAVWRAMSPLRRHDIMIEAVRLLRERTESIAAVMTLEQGKPIAQSRLEVQRAADMIAWDASEGRRLYGRVIPAEGGMKLTVVREPIGIVAAFSPWNFPLSAPARKVGGALAAGCAIILKASEETPGSAMLLAKAFQDAGLPPGVLNLVFGEPAAISDFLITHPAVRTVTFTGSVPVGKHLAALTARSSSARIPIPRPWRCFVPPPKRVTPDKFVSRRRASSCMTRSMTGSWPLLPSGPGNSRWVTDLIRHPTSGL